MIEAGLPLLMLLAALSVPVAWAAPRALAADAVAAWTILCVALISPATALWLLAVAAGLSPLLHLADAPGRRDLAAALACAALLGAFAAARLSPGWGWVGGAFFTLRGLHVVAEWWMGRMAVPSVRDSLRYHLFLPVLASGPIHRAPHFERELRRRRWDPEMFWSGAERALRGLVLLYVCSGVLEKLRDKVPVWNLPGFFDSWMDSTLAWIDLYFVFAGATDFALGVALMIGLRLEENFNRPWAARSLPEFWTRWHMSLTLWVRDYVFRPVLAMSRRPVLAVGAAMLVIGLWHEFSAYYVLWSGWQALGIVLSRIVPPPPLGRAVAVLGPLGVLAWLSLARPVIETLLALFSGGGAA